MNPQNDPTNPAGVPNPGLSLPPVDPSQTPQPQTVPAVPAPTPVAAPAPSTEPPVPVNPAQPPAAPQAVPDDSTPPIADDADLIEKAWVEKAKQLVDQTKNDPYNQNKQINKFKASYIKKRYNKDIQLSKD